MITQEILQKNFYYDEITGKFIKIKNNKEYRTLANGYVIVYFNYIQYYVHRLAFLYKLGYIPDEIDHIDGDRSNNCWANLREVTRAENCKNKRLLDSNKFGIPGIYNKKTKKGLKWWARIEVNKNIYHLGTFSSREEAILARKNAEKKYGFHANHGRI